MTVGVTLHGLTMGLFLVSLKGLTCQELIFENGIQHDIPNGGKGNWTAVGKIKLTTHDTIMFEPLVNVQAVTDMCSIDLRSCAPDGQISTKPKACYCTKASDEDYNLFLSGHNDLPPNDFTVQATVPSRYLFSPLSLIATVGELRVPCKEKESPDACSGRVAQLEEALDTERQALVSLKAERQKDNEIKTQLTTLTNMIKAQNNMIENQNTVMENQREIMENQTRMIQSLTAQLETQNNKLTNDTEDTTRPDTCAEVHSSSPRPVVTLSNGFEVVCDVVTDNGGWVVIQRRASSDVSFYRNWDEYKYGFGQLDGNFWLGLEKVHVLTLKRQYELRVDLKYNGKTYYAHYKSFNVLGEAEKYKLLVSGYSGNSSDGLSYHSGRSFTTKDADNDIYPQNCATKFRGAWWYGGCHNSNLNGLWGSKAYGQGVVWHTTTGDYASASFTEMKIRPLGP